MSRLVYIVGTWEGKQRPAGRQTKVGYLIGSNPNGGCGVGKRSRLDNYDCHVLFFSCKMLRSFQSPHSKGPKLWFVFKSIFELMARLYLLDYSM